MNTFLLIFLIVLFSSFIIERFLEYLNTTRWTDILPEELKDFYDANKYKESQNYLQVKHHFSTISSSFSFVITVAMIFWGIFGCIDQWIFQMHLTPLLHALLFFGIIGLLADLISVPFDLFQTFVIEEKFGFNKTTVKTFIIDKLKGYLIAAIIGVLLISAIIWFYEKTGTYFWLYAWGTISVFLVLITMFYSNLIVPLFNKQKPLEEGELRHAIEEFGQKAGFKIDNIFVIDGSKRSTKANAYFSGLGSKKRIVLYDTLIKNHTTEELVSVLAHEIGHYKLKHTTTGIILSILNTGFTLFVLSLFIGKDSPIALDICQALGAERASFHVGIIGFAILYSPLSLIIGLFTNVLSRKNEIAADAFAKTHYSAKPLQDALIKLSVNNLSNMLPHPAYVFFYYSHPPLLERLRALKGE